MTRERGLLAVKKIEEDRLGLIYVRDGLVRVVYRVALDQLLLYLQLNF